MRRALTNEEFLGVQSGAFPSLKFSADQWGEYGYFYDPTSARFGSYSIDRKDQSDDVLVIQTAAEVLSHCDASQRQAVSAWLASL